MHDSTRGLRLGPASRWRNLLRALGRRATLSSSGTAIAYLIAALLTPLLTRAYSPAEFGAFALATSVASVIGAVGALRLELVLMGDRAVEEAEVLARAGILAATASAGLSLTVMLMVQLLLGEKGNWLPIVLVAALCWCNAAWSVVSALAVKKDRLGDLAAARICRAVVSVITAIVLAGSLEGTGLIAGSVIGGLVGVLVMAKASFPPVRSFGARDVVALMSQASIYREQSRFGMVGSGLSALSAQAPVLVLGWTASAEAVGAFAFARRTLGSLVSLVGTAAADAIRAFVSSRDERVQAVRDVWLAAFLILGSLGLAVTLGFSAVPDALVERVAGSDWGQVGRFVRIMAPWFGLGIVASPLSVVLVLRDRIGLDAVWQAANGLLILLGISVGDWAGGPFGAIYGLTVAGCASYVAYIVITYRASVGAPSPSGG